MTGIISRFASPYLPTKTEAFDTPSFTGEAQTRLEALAILAARVPRTLTNDVSTFGRGKYCFIAFGGEKDLPIALAICYIIPTANPGVEGEEQRLKTLDWGLITDLVVDPTYRRKKIANQLISEVIRRLTDEDILLASGNTKGSLDFLRVAIDSHRQDCQRVFEGCKFERLRGDNGERIYEYSLQPSRRKPVGKLEKE